MPVAVKGLVETQRALRKFDPDLYKAMQAEIRPELSGMARKAKSLVPKYFLSGSMSDGSERQSRIDGRKRAFPTYDNVEIRRGLTYSMGKQKRQRNGWQSMYSLLNKSAMGAIVETAGRKNPYGDPESQSNNPNAGRQFIDRANQISGFKQVGKGRKNQGRLAFAAVADNMGRARAAIMDSIERAEAKFRSATR